VISGLLGVQYSVVKMATEGTRVPLKQAWEQGRQGVHVRIGTIKGYTRYSIAGEYGKGVVR
jgi:hypothetical protein